jgi:hypothetical protein
MATILPTLEVFEKFIDIGKEIARLPQLVLPQYQAAARDLYEISQRLLTANENLSRWLYRFLYFDFRQTDSRSRFLELVRDYKTMKQGAEFRQLKFSCSDISAIYHRNIASKLGNWFTDETRRREVEGTFKRLSDADGSLVVFTYEHVVRNLDRAADEMETRVENGAIDDAESVRLRTKTEMKDITGRLESFAGELSDLVISFAATARAPVTLARA